MAFGVECRDSSGNLVVTVERVANRFASGTFSVGANSSADVTIPGIYVSSLFMIILFKSSGSVWPSQIIQTVYADYVNFRNLSTMFSGTFEYLVLKV